MKNKSFVLRLLMSSILLGFLISCGSETVNSENEGNASENSSQIFVTNKQFEMGNMEFVNLEEHPFLKTINSNGFINVPPESFASISPYFGGYIKEIQLLTGQRVSQGQTLFVLENPDYLETQQNYLEAKSQLNYLKLDYERQKDLAKENITSQKNYLKAESEYRMIQARYESLRKKLQLMGINPSSVSESNLRSTIAISSPISGYITEINASKGLYLNPSDVAVKIMNTDQIFVELSVFEQDLMQIHENQRVTFRLQHDSKQHEAFVFLINKVIDPKTRAIKVLCKLSSKETIGSFTPGMYVEAEIVSTTSMGFGLPEEAVISAGVNSYVLVLEKKTKKGFSFTKTQVKTNSRNEGFIEVLNASTISKTKQILGKGAFNLINE